MKKIKKHIKRYILALTPKSIIQIFEKLWGEAEEHLEFVAWAIGRIILPLAVFYVIFGLFSGVNVLGSLALSFFVFLYSSFLPDLDLALMNKKGKTPEMHDKILLLWLGPLYLLYLFEKKKRLSTRSREFHRLKALIGYGIFLTLIGILFYFDSPIKIFVLISFGVIGYGSHLAIDRCLKF